MAHTIEAPIKAPEIGTHWSKQSILVLPPHAPREQWLAARMAGIGASDASAILGMSRYKTPLSLWATKTGALTHEHQSKSALMGHLLEPVLGSIFEDTYHMPLATVGLLRSVDRPWQMATPDRAVVGEPILVEFKTTAAHMAPAWDRDQTPDHAELQVQHQLAVTGFEAAYVVVMIGGQWPQFRYITRDDELIQLINEREEHFWFDHVIPRIAPPACADDDETLTTLHPNSTHRKADLPPDARVWIAEYRQAHQTMKEAETRKKNFGNLLRQTMGDARIGLIDDHEVVTYTEVERTAFSEELMRSRAPKIYRRYFKTTTSRRLTIKD